MGKQKVQSEIKSGRPNADMRGASKKKKAQGVFAVGIRVQELRGSGFKDFGYRVWGFGGLWMKTL